MPPLPAEGVTPNLNFLQNLGLFSVKKSCNISCSLIPVLMLLFCSQCHLHPLHLFRAKSHSHFKSEHIYHIVILMPCESGWETQIHSQSSHSFSVIILSPYQSVLRCQPLLCMLHEVPVLSGTWSESFAHPAHTIIPVILLSKHWLHEEIAI